jgi:hypothetical protein
MPWHRFGFEGDLGLANHRDRWTIIGEREVAVLESHGPPGAPPDSLLCKVKSGGFDVESENETHSLRHAYTWVRCNSTDSKDRLNLPSRVYDAPAFMLYERTLLIMRRIWMTSTEGCET